MSAAAVIARSLWRAHKVLACILVLEYALTFAIVLSAAAVAGARLQAIHTDSGVADEEGLYVVEAGSGFGSVRRSDWAQALDRLRESQGRSAVAIGSSVPFLGRASTNLAAQVGDEEGVEVAVYAGGRSFLKVLGVRLVAGRYFLPSEALERGAGQGEAHVAILSEPLARRLFHGGPALGRQVSLGASTYTVVGLCGALASPQYRGRVATSYTAVLPGGRGSSSSDVLLVRARDPVALGRDLQRLNAATEGRVSWSSARYGDIKAHYFRADRLALWGLVASGAAVLLTSLCGVLGLTRYWVGRRRLQIAIRRALGATRRDVFVHFTCESAALVGVGLVTGMCLALSASPWTGLALDGGLAPAPLFVAVLVTFALAMAAVYFSLRQFVDMQPMALARMA